MKALTLAICALLTVQSASAASAEITQDRGWRLAGDYFRRYFPRLGCGGPALPVRHGNFWQSTVLLGYAGKPSGTIRVQSRTGSVSYEGPFLLKPTVSAGSLDRWEAASMARPKNP